MNRGRPKAAMPTEPVSTRLPQDIVAVLREEAEEKEWSLSQLLAKIVKDWVASQKGSIER